MRTYEEALHRCIVCYEPCCDCGVIDEPCNGCSLCAQVIELEKEVRECLQGSDEYDAG